MTDMYGKVDKAILTDEWARTLRGFSPAELEAGLSACATRRFAPTLGEFAQLCRPSLDPEVAWHEAVEGLAARARGEVGVWSHPAVYRAAIALNHEVRTSTFRFARNRWEPRLHSEFAAGWGDGVPDAIKGIANNARLERASPEWSAKLREIRRQIAGGRS